MGVVVAAMVVVVVVEMVMIVINGIRQVRCAHNAINAINSNLLIYFYPDEKRKLELVFTVKSFPFAENTVTSRGKVLC